jgi:hypothetical protein
MQGTYGGGSKSMSIESWQEVMGAGRRNSWGEDLGWDDDRERGKRTAEGSSVEGE